MGEKDVIIDSVMALMGNKCGGGGWDNYPISKYMVR